MKNKSAFTVIELLTVIAIVVILFSLVFASVRHLNSTTIDPYWFPEQAQAKAQQDMADQMRVQNELLRRQIELKERKGE
jgi:prepilin-type N-terminal cleavage/methylation domain-containing protein